MKRIGFLSFALVATLIAGCSGTKGKDLGQAKSTEPATVGTTGAAEIASRDAKDFIHYVAIVNTAEIDLGKTGGRSRHRERGQEVRADDDRRSHGVR